MLRIYLRNAVWLGGILTQRRRSKTDIKHVIGIQCDYGDHSSWTIALQLWHCIDGAPALRRKWVHRGVVISLLEIFLDINADIDLCHFPLTHAFPFSESHVQRRARSA